jgi:MFS family permease
MAIWLMALDSEAFANASSATAVAVLQTALTPAFLLVALGQMLNLFSGRLTRIVDRTRTLEARYPDTTGAEHDRIVTELRVLEKRLVTVGRAILLGVLAAIVVAMMIALLFFTGLFGARSGLVIIVAFLIALGLLTGSLLYFVREVHLATKLIHVREEYLERD